MLVLKTRLLLCILPYAILATLLFPRDVFATEPFDVKAHYDKSELMITMRDGVKLFTSIYSPADHSQTYPILLFRTPYSAAPYGPDIFREAQLMAPSEDFLRAGYIFVYQEARGTYKSDGTWVNLKPVRSDPKATDETTDTYDTIDWLVKNAPNNNGRVGQWGISHAGWFTVMGMVKAHPALKAASPQATTFDPFIGDDSHRNGAFLEVNVDWWYLMSNISGPDRARFVTKPPDPIDYGTSWNFEFFLNAGPMDQLNDRYYGGRMTQLWQNNIEHPDYDEYWQNLNVRKSLGHVQIPVLNVMGWFDSHDPYGAMATYHAIDELNPKNRSTLVAGPWFHGGWARSDGSKLGDIEFGSKTSEYYQANIVFPFFEHYLKDKGNWSSSKAIVFETGNNRWHHLSQWPPRGVTARNIYFRANGKLTFDPPAERSNTYDSYISDPAHPVPYTPEILRDRGETFMVGDQRFAFSRPDVMTYQTDVLESDTTIAGPIPVGLYVSTSGTDSDWFVKLIDVYPEDVGHENDPSKVKMAGYQMLVGTEVMRSKYRNSFSKPEPMMPDQPTPVSFEIRDKFHTFKKGHKIMVQVQSSWFPMIDRNPQTFTNIYRARDSEYKIATQKIYRSAEMPSHLILPVVTELSETR